MADILTLMNHKQAVAQSEQGTLLEVSEQATEYSFNYWSTGASPDEDMQSQKYF